MNRLYSGDNLVVLRGLSSESVDLVYLDPPFKSGQDYNVIFRERDGARSAAQIKAFKDTWSWDETAKKAWEATVEVGDDLADAMIAFEKILGHSDMLAYLSMMAPRLVELRRVMKGTASIYLHCDPTASHYLKVMMDHIFGAANFRNEIIWRRTGSHNSARRYGPIHDIILFYTRSDTYTWNNLRRPYMRGHVEKAFVVAEGGGYRTNYSGNVLSGSGRRGGESGKPWRGFDPDAKGRHWAIPKRLLEGLDDDLSALGTHRKLDYLYEHGLVTIKPGDEWPRYQRSIDEDDGQPLSDLWAYQPYTEGTVFGTEAGIDDDVRWMGTKDSDRLGYPTQKPIGLLLRIVQASSREGDVVCDPFCGCGTTIDAAERLGRQWIGIDITAPAIDRVKERLAPDVEYEILRVPVSVADARELALDDPHQFERWALGLVGVTDRTKRRGADRGIDGRRYFRERGGEVMRQIVFSVKSGHVTVSQVRDLRGVIEREHVDMGVLITMQKPTRAMRMEALAAGFYDSPFGKHPRLQLLTIEELLTGHGVDAPLPGDSAATDPRRAPIWPEQVTLPLPLKRRAPAPVEEPEEPAIPRRGPTQIARPAPSRRRKRS